MPPISARVPWSWLASRVEFPIRAGRLLFAPRPYYYVAPPVYVAPPPPVFAPLYPAPPVYVQPDPGVRWVQESLNILGFGPLNVDGIQGPATTDAIYRFQIANGLYQDGIAGSATTYLIQRRLEATAHAAGALAGPPPRPPVHHEPPPAKEGAPS